MQERNRILIVEDELSLLKLESVLLSVKGFEVITAYTGKMALDLIGVAEFDLVLLDIMLPDIDGFEVCRQLRNDPRTAAVPVIMLTGKKEPHDHECGMLCGAAAYMEKPFKSALVVEEINRQLLQSSTGT
jgi:twitching motility two-component system response regulator PilG